ncbi:hypothetical protein SLEP1_g32336 [Rubroshorea leprosula]|uniref:Uncharacterized protein n=1 Tax=Rubroshorea leprosula TaxID=152421 RepID=A0AAV5KCY9_9ROSI|nr:hypothetical protein SLEP1_g32336 [Rubroshorea leprosula]
MWHSPFVSVSVLGEAGLKDQKAVFPWKAALEFQKHQ